MKSALLTFAVVCFITGAIVGFVMSIGVVFIAALKLFAGVLT